MFFLITNIVIGKYYPNLVTQIIIGCTCYVLSFFIIKDVIDNESFNEYKYYILSLIAADFVFIAYKAKNCVNANSTKQFHQNIMKENKIDNTTSEQKTGSMYSVSLSSEINDFRITHDLSFSESNEENSMFSSSNEKSNDHSEYSQSSDSDNTTMTNRSDKTITDQYETNIDIFTS